MFFVIMQKGDGQSKRFIGKFWQKEIYKIFVINLPLNANFNVNYYCIDYIVMYEY